MASKGEQMRAAIIEAAKDLFYHQGYHVTSYGDLAEVINCGKGKIHYYFNSKDDMLKAVIANRIDGIRELLEEWSLNCGTAYDCIERFITMLDRNAEDLSKYGCPMGTLNTELGKQDEELQRHARQMFDLFQRWLAARFRSILPQEQADLHAEELMIMAQGASLFAHSRKDPALISRETAKMRQWLHHVCLEN